MTDETELNTVGIIGRCPELEEMLTLLENFKLGTQKSITTPGVKTHIFSTLAGGKKAGYWITQRKRVWYKNIRFYENQRSLRIPKNQEFTQFVKKTSEKLKKLDISVNTDVSLKISNGIAQLRSKELVLNEIFKRYMELVIVLNDNTEAELAVLRPQIQADAWELRKINRLKFIVKGNLKLLQTADTDQKVEIFNNIFAKTETKNADLNSTELKQGYFYRPFIKLNTVKATYEGKTRKLYPSSASGILGTKISSINAKESARAGIKERHKDLVLIATNLSIICSSLPYEKGFLSIVLAQLNQYDQAILLEEYHKQKHALTPVSLLKRGGKAAAVILGQSVINSRLGQATNRKIAALNNRLDRAKQSALMPIKYFRDSFVIAHDEEEARRKDDTTRAVQAPVVSNVISYHIVNVARYTSKKKSEVGSFNPMKIVGKVVGDAIDRTVTTIKATALRAATTLGIVKYIRTGAGALKGVGTVINGVAGTVKVVGAGITNGIKTALPGAAIGFVTAGPGGALLGAAGGTIVGGVTNSVVAISRLSFAEMRGSVFFKGFRAIGNIGRISFLKKTGFGKALRKIPVYLDKFWKGNTVNFGSSSVISETGAAGRMVEGRLHTKLMTTFKAIGSGIMGAGIGATIATLINPAAGVLGMVIGGAGGITAQIVGDRIANKLAQTAAGNGFALLRKLPFNSYLGMVTGHQWLNSQVRMLLGRADAAELEAYGWKNPLSVALNLAQLGTYLSSTYSAIGGTFTLIGKGGISMVGRAIGGIGSRVANLLPGVGSTIGRLGNYLQNVTLVGNLSRASLLGGTVGGFVGSAAGIIVANLFGLNVAVMAAIGGTLGAVIGGILGSALGPLGTFIGSGLGSFFGTLAGSLADTFFAKLLPYVPSPFIIIQGLFDFIRLMTARIRSLEDYANIGMIALNLVNFLVAMSRMLSNNNIQTGATYTSSSSMLNGKNLVVMAAQIDYSPDGKSMLINKDQPAASYLIANVDKVAELVPGSGTVAMALNNNTQTGNQSTGKQLAAQVQDKYLLINNVGSYAYDPEARTLQGKVAGVSTDTVTQVSSSDSSKNVGTTITAYDYDSSANKITAIAICSLSGSCPEVALGKL